MEVISHPDMPGLAIKLYTDKSGNLQTELLFTDTESSEQMIYNLHHYEATTPELQQPKPEAKFSEPEIPDAAPPSREDLALKPLSSLPCSREVESFDRALDHPKHHLSQQAAKAICASCTKLEECRQYALEHDELLGVWGGLSASERKLLMLQRRRSNQRLTT